MNKVTMEQREAIVREAIAKRDAIATGFPICNETNHPKDPSDCWNVRCQLGNTCCRTGIATPQPAAAPPMTLKEFCAEADRTGLTAETLAKQLAVRPEFADCLPEAQPAAAPVVLPVQFRGSHNADDVMPLAEFLKGPSEAQMLQSVAAMTQDQRGSLLSALRSEYCECGSTDKSCQCQNDE